MYDGSIYGAGVTSLLKAAWTVRLETPLAVRNGDQVGYTESKIGNGPNELALAWETPETGNREVAALHFGYEIVDGQVHQYHFVPASSVRGALRSWTIRQFVQPTHQRLLMSEPAGNENNEPPHDNVSPHDKDTAQALEDKEPNARESVSRPRARTAEQIAEQILHATAPSSETTEQLSSVIHEDRGIQLIASVFGLATGHAEDNLSISNAGRLRLETAKFGQAELRAVDVSGLTMAADAGPDNVSRQMTVRSPLDRVTHAPREPGLHHFLEFRRGQTFRLHMTFVNPHPYDLGLLSVWRTELQVGLLRFGALSSIGRGRVTLQDESYIVWQRRDAEPFDGLSEQGAVAATTRKDVLDDLFTARACQSQALADYEEHLTRFIQGNDNAQAESV